MDTPPVTPIKHLGYNYVVAFTITRTMGLGSYHANFTLDGRPLNFTAVPVAVSCPRGEVAVGDKCGTCPSGTQCGTHDANHSSHAQGATLATLELSQNRFRGALPAAWGDALPALRELRAAHRARDMD